MIIYKNGVNKIGVTLKEKQTLTLSDFVFKFTNDTTGNSVTCSAVDISDYTDRINIFYIEETSNPNPYNGQVSLDLEGQWTYTIYELPQASPRILDISQSVAIVETGILIVNGTGTIIDVRVFYTDQNKNTGVFDE